MRKLSCAIIEDSNVQRILLEKTIKQNIRLELKYSFSSSIEALKTLNSKNVDILFLDVEMPEMNGFEFLSRLQCNAQIIITSQHPKYALDAFEYYVTDYLLKPYSLRRFEIAIQKALEKAVNNHADRTQHTLTIKHNLKQVELYVNNIQWVEALGDYVKVITPERNYIVLSTLSAFQKKLGDEKFLRIHKSYIVNLKMVDRYNHQYIEINNRKLPLSRTKKLKLDELLNYLE